MPRSFFHATIAIILISSIFNTKAQINTPCSSAIISTFTPCLNFITGSSGTGSSPTRDCCGSLKSLMTDNMDCVCLIVTGNVPVSIPFINAAISLPRVCKNSVPLQCKATGVPLPPPGPVLFGPTPAPSPSPTLARAHAPHHSHTSESAVAAVPAPQPAASLDAAPTSPRPTPKSPLGASTNLGIKPVVEPNLASTLSKFQPRILIFVVIVASMF
ncbi:hypothetical protein CASFOL_005222 [Castilleja foliolosa]|uniref:Bifunctional inhibitor/plant lipid transfer protein/seed storage helical domain-containing protein n=1 Tax=Castilleja foliolosa TaxID=1961234 RepID=A0ABD3E6U4_9LAMI